MATTFTPSNRWLRELHEADVDVAADTFKVILMDTGFTFNRDTHDTYAGVSASELATGNGYTQNTKLLANVDVTNIEDDTNDRSDIAWDDVVWTATGTLGPSPGAIIFDDTHANDVIVGYHDFGGDVSATDADFTLSSPLSRIQAV